MSRKRPREPLHSQLPFPLDVLNNIARFLPLYDALKLRMLCRATAGCPGTPTAVALTPALKWTWRLNRRQLYALQMAVQQGDVRLRAALGPGTSIHTLNFAHVFRKITDVSMYGNVHTLDLSWVAGVNDVSALGNVHTLSLRGTHVTDVSQLGNVHTLSLSGTNVTDVSQLGNVHSLDLSYTDVEDVSALGNVHTLDLRETDVTDTTALHNVKYLTLPDGTVVQK